MDIDNKLMVPRGRGEGEVLKGKEGQRYGDERKFSFE